MRQYRSLKKESKDLDKKLNKLYDRQEAIPEVMGKVTGSSPEFPYIETHPTIIIAEPKKNDAVKRLIRAKKNRKKMVDETAVEIETFITNIEDSKVRRVFELRFIDGLKQKEVAEEVGYSRSRISQIVSDYLKD
ncbi:MAG: sigma factor-like helix-turn-helix DNA-binding protein [Anaerostipes sp.]|nr:sigma factor-like helix-turn-helix DNA-binding protein [Anaerostipes sp.]MDD3747663.1 sigma factor-like helix-turn-helix DNA-binding protein [Anaerostipes sp.]